MRHCELLKGTKIDGIVYILIMDGGPGSIDLWRGDLEVSADKTNNKKVIAILFLAHMINDMYMNFLTILLPVLITLYRFTIAQASLLVSCFVLSSSLTQPFFGYLVDKKQHKWLLFSGTLWMATFLSLIGKTSNLWIMVCLAGAAGMGTAVFHVQAASIIFNLSEGRKGFIMSSFIAVGNIGLVLGPLLFVPLIENFGTKGIPLIAIPGLAASGLLFIFNPQAIEMELSSKSFKDMLFSLKGTLGELNKLMSVVAIRTLFYTGLTTLLPLYLKLQKMPPKNIGYVLSLMLFSGAIGGLMGGFVSDKYGRKLVIVFSMIATTPSLLGFYYIEGVWKYLFLALAGAAIMASSPVTVVAIQELIPKNKATASGLSLGFSMGIGGLLVGLIGKYADLFGIGQAIILLSWLPLFGSLFAMALGSKLKSQPRDLAS